LIVSSSSSSSEISSPIRKVAAGCYSSCALSREGKVYVWGQNAGGEVGQRDTQHVWLPTLLRVGADRDRDRNKAARGEGRGARVIDVQLGYSHGLLMLGACLNILFILLFLYLVLIFILFLCWFSLRFFFSFFGCACVSLPLSDTCERALTLGSFSSASFYASPTHLAAVVPAHVSIPGCVLGTGKREEEKEGDEKSEEGDRKEEEGEEKEKGGGELITRLFSLKDGSHVADFSSASPPSPFSPSSPSSRFSHSSSASSNFSSSSSSSASFLPAAPFPFSRSATCFSPAAHCVCNLSLPLIAQADPEETESDTDSETGTEPHTGTQSSALPVLHRLVCAPSSSSSSSSASSEVLDDPCFGTFTPSATQEKDAKVSELRAQTLARAMLAPWSSAALLSDPRFAVSGGGETDTDRETETGTERKYEESFATPEVCVCLVPYLCLCLCLSLSLSVALLVCLDLCSRSLVRCFLSSRHWLCVSSALWTFSPPTYTIHSLPPPLLSHPPLPLHPLPLPRPLSLPLPCPMLSGRKSKRRRGK